MRKPRFSIWGSDSFIVRFLALDTLDLRPEQALVGLVRLYFLTRDCAGGTQGRAGCKAWPAQLAELEGVMAHRKAWFVTMAIVIGLSGFCRGGAALAQAQTKGDTPRAAGKLTEQETRGEGLFLQRCSICHLPRKLKFGSPSVVGPSLGGLFKDADPEQQKILRNFILKGGPDMPGFQYGLETKEVDDLVAYLKTL